LAAALLLAALAGCRRAPPPGPPPDGVYRLPINGNPIHLDPARFTDVDSEGVARRIFNTLVTLDAALQPAPELAERWDFAEGPGGPLYTFHLRRGVRFHNGRELTSSDVRYSFERVLRKETLSHSAWVMLPIAGAAEFRDGRAATVAGIETPSPHVVRLRLREPFGPFLSHMAMGNAAIVPREEVERAEDLPFSRRPVGTGPFRFVRWRDNDVVELVRNEDYFAGAPKLAGVRFRVIKEPLVALQEYVAGHLEHCAVPEGYMERLRTGKWAGQFQSTPTLSIFFIGITMTRQPGGGDARLRRAMNYAVNREFLCNRVLGGTYEPARGLLPPGLPGASAEVGYTYDPARAREELRLAGYGPGNPPPPMTLYFTVGASGNLIAQAVQSDLRKVGIPVRLQVLDRAALLKATNDGEPDLFRLSWIADFPDADNFLGIFHTSRFGSSGNRVRYSNPLVDDLIIKSRRATGPERAALIKQAERIIVDDAPWIFLMHGRTNLLVKPYVRNFKIGPMDVGTSVNRVDFDAVSFETSAVAQAPSLAAVTVPPPLSNGAPPP
jgi:peptide/nickel transport system substrate-binding protein/oligopeptide transport system substrate-binding protein